MSLSIGRTLIGLVGFATAIGGHVMDWNETHIYNPRWPPHAKFHNGQTMAMGVFLGLTTLYYLYGPPSTSVTAAAVQQKQSALYTASWIASLYWITQLLALFYPDSLAIDPEFGEGAPQVYISGGLLSVIVIGTVLEGRRIAALEKDEKSD